MMTVLVVIAGFFAVSLSTPTKAYADDTLVYVVTDNAKVRSEKSTSASGKAVKAGTTLEVAEKRYSEWYTVTKGPQGIPSPGYIHKSDVETSLRGSNKAFDGATKTTLKLHSYPSNSAPVVTTLEPGTVISWTKYNVEWAWAKLDNDHVFFRLKDLAPYTTSDRGVHDGIVNNKKLKLYPAPNKQTTPRDTVAEGTSISFIEFDNEFMIALLDNKPVFLDKDSIVLYQPKTKDVFTRQIKNDKTYVYLSPSTKGTKKGTVAAGTVMNFTDFNGTWFMGIFKQGDQKFVGFVQAKDVGEVQGDAWLIAARSNAPMYANPDGANVGTVRKGTIVDGTFAGGTWYSITYYKDGRAQKAYVTTKDFRPMTDKIKIVQKYTDYPINFRSYVSNQLNGQKVNKYFDSAGDYSQAPSNLVSWYMNPNNFPAGSTGYLQFLRLDKPAGVAISALNTQLNNEGVLAGHGKAFSQAAYTHNVNELYLVSHAIHETGHGKSNLAKGVYYNPYTNETRYTPFDGATKVYNMYGIAATDNNALNGGAKRAYDEGWTSVDKAIIGGAQFVSKNYLRPRNVTLSGQNTLYKMLWHPEYNARYGKQPWHQYATDIAWADAQTYYLSQLYADYSAYTMTFDVPRFR